jgi:hypothetical protein
VGDTELVGVDDTEDPSSELTLADPDSPEVTGGGEVSSAAAAALTEVTVCPAGAAWVAHQITGAATIKASPVARPVAARRRDILVRAVAGCPDCSVRACGSGTGGGH